MARARNRSSDVSAQPFTVASRPNDPAPASVPAASRRMVPGAGFADAAFVEAPFAFVMDPANHQRQSREWKGAIRHFYAMPWESRYIWGVTAGILRNLYERLYT